jgi:myosin heavy subunit
MEPLALAIQKIAGSELGTIYYVGAGSGSWVDNIAALRPTKIFAYEASEELFSALKNKCKKYGFVEPRNQWVLPKGVDECEVTSYQNPRYNSLVPKENSFSHAKSNLDYSVQRVSGIPLEQAIDAQNIDASKNNILILDIDAELEEQTADATESLRVFSSIFIVSKKEFGGSHYLLGNSADFIECPQVTSQDVIPFTILMRNNEKICEAKNLEDTQHRLNTKLQEVETELASAKEALQTSQSQSKELAQQKDKAVDALSQKDKELTSKNDALSELNSKFTHAQDDLEEQKKWHATHKERAEKYLAELEKSKSTAQKAQQLEGDLNAQIKVNSELKDELSTLKKQLDAAIESTKVNNTALENITEQFKHMQQDALADLKGKVYWKIDKGLNNAVKQVESFIGVQRFLEKGEISMEFHGWPISSDIALYLLGQIKERDYDLIIEFGSGTSTQLFAKAMEFKGGQKSKTADVPSLKTSDSDDISIDRSVVTFEHNKKYFEKTQKLLKQKELLSIVNLVHAPLIDIELNGESFLYYDCETELNNIASKFAKHSAKILVLVDGPPGSTGPLARLPALSKLLNALGHHQLDIILDDSNRAEEKTIIAKWKETLESRFVPFEEEEIPCEKGAYVLRLNP